MIKLFSKEIKVGKQLRKRLDSVIAARSVAKDNPTDDKSLTELRRASMELSKYAQDHVDVLPMNLAMGAYNIAEGYIGIVETELVRLEADKDSFYYHGIIAGGH